MSWCKRSPSARSVSYPVTCLRRGGRSSPPGAASPSGPREAAGMRFALQPPHCQVLVPFSRACEDLQSKHRERKAKLNESSPRINKARMCCSSAYRMEIRKAWLRFWWHWDSNSWFFSPVKRRDTDLQESRLLTNVYMSEKICLNSWYLQTGAVSEQQSHPVKTATVS